MNPPEKSRAERILEITEALSRTLELDERRRLLLMHRLEAIWHEADYEATKRTNDIWSKHFMPPVEQALRTLS